ncbi:hypothetical protein E1263_14840 [Kribbella antibiotica]|uniref:Uncharacterized protein n=1 Tax=Kribbella antibiotica TaxID=190195 RepID=A0A4R4ZNX8_9ACTN|nr:hypothetical protein [Kribbella antibiotica]TDD59459.1 hypothetical protein E1263_14840 [Kribbella antibiotica]
MAARRAKRVQRAGRPGFLIGALIAGAVQLVAAFGFGVGAGMLFDEIRGSSIDSSGPGLESVLGMATIPVLMMGGLLGLFIAGATARYLVDAYRGGEKQPALQTPLAFWAFAGGVALDARSWNAPLTGGETFDPVFNGNESWSGSGGVMDHADIWFPALFAVIALLVTLFAIRHNRRLRQQVAERNRLLAEGRKVTGQITDVTVRTSTNDDGHHSIVGAEVIVKFTDLQGTDRWVTRTVQGREAVPSLGEALVLFDPLRPDVVDAIFVAFVPDPLPGDWIGTVA